MYIVRRAFRGPTGPLSVGSIIEPTDIRMFRYHLQEKHIVEVNEQNLERYATLFKDRFCIDLKALIVAKTAEGVEEAKAKQALAERMEVIPYEIATEYFNFPDGDNTSIEVVQEAVEKAEAKAAEVKAAKEAKVAEEAKAAEEAKTVSTKPVVKPTVSVK